MNSEPIFCGRDINAGQHEQVDRHGQPFGFHGEPDDRLVERHENAVDGVRSSRE